MNGWTVFIMKLLLIKHEQAQSRAMDVSVEKAQDRGRSSALQQSARQTNWWWAEFSPSPRRPHPR